ncbi:hypothetical protein [Kangiella sp. TOML190]|uniref:hypothetical protein n=1 Tax=Kangiella sp. TOML190 TaxID=2931351 RepID=UPI00203E2EF6|nr:hypothetical protein [Kangiella sp. TOML190]
MVGVFIGIQVANWNETQTNKKQLIISLERLDKEVSQNISNINLILNHYQASSKNMEIGREALNACDYSPENQAALESLMFQFVEDVLPNFVTEVLDQLGRQDRYRPLLSLSFQDSLSHYSARIAEEHEQLTSHYNNLWAYHVNYHSSVSAYFSGNPIYKGDTSDFEGWGFKLAQPFEIVCKDASFRNRFINTIGFFTSINMRLKRFKAETIEFQEVLKSEIGEQ